MQEQSQGTGDKEEEKESKLKSIEEELEEDEGEKEMRCCDEEDICNIDEDKEGDDSENSRYPSLVSFNNLCHLSANRI